MLSRVGQLFAAEMVKVWRTKFPYLGLAASALMALIARQSVESLSQPGSNITAPSYFVASINMSTTIIIPIFATIFAAMMVAGETSRGTLRTILARPVTRADFLTAKLLTAVFYLLLLLAANAAVALIIAMGYPLKTSFDANIDIPGAAGQFAIFSLALLLTLVPQIATVCFGFFVSVFSASVATSIGVAVGVLLSLQPVKQFIRFGSFDLDEWLFSSYYDTAMRIADNMAMGIYEEWAQTEVYMLLATSFVSILVFLVLSYHSFVRRDLNC
ncbi:MAG: ABC transporter permease subunit [bacterium]|nr:ABC transporter permease subunit [Candidatus Sumerlaeota bacterium]